MPTGKVKVTKEILFSKVGEDAIYRYYLGRDFKLGRPLPSPFHEDENPSFGIILSPEGNWIHTDFATGQTGNCVDFVMQLFNLSFYEALNKINHDFGLDIKSISDKKECQRVVNEATYEPKKETIIQVVAGRWRKDELAYWQEYHIDKGDLRLNGVYPVRKLFLNGNTFLLPVGELVFGYLFGEKWKIYRPFAHKKLKWMTNIPIDTMSGLWRIKGGIDRGFVTKSKKDEMVLAKFLPSICSTQNESKFAINGDNLAMLQSNCKEVYLNFDSDEVGVNASKHYNQFGFKWVNCPNGFVDPKGGKIKDFADLARYHGMETVIDHFKSKKLI